MNFNFVDLGVTLIFVIIFGLLWGGLMSLRTRRYLKKNYEQTPEYINSTYRWHVVRWFVVAAIIWVGVFVWNWLRPHDFSPFLGLIQRCLPFKGWADHLILPLHIGHFVGISAGLLLGSYLTIKSDGKCKGFCRSFLRFCSGLVA